MKNKILTLAVTVIMAGTMATGCQSSATKVENAENKLEDAKDKVDVAKQELNQALKDSIQQFRKASEETINANEVKIAEFRVKIAKEKKENRAGDERRLAEMEQQNNDMRKRLEAFNEDQRENWNSFRLKFKHDMDEFGQAMRDFWGGRR